MEEPTDVLATEEPGSSESKGSGASSCGCGKSGGCGCGSAVARSFESVFALGELGIDFGSEARRDSILQQMEGGSYDLSALLRYLDENPWEASSVIWTLGVDGTPIYALLPTGPFAAEAYQRLREFLADQLKGHIERVSIGGVIGGQITLLSDIEVPLLLPELRCTRSWRTDSLVEALGGRPSAKSPGAGQQAASRKSEGLRNFLERIYYELRNTGRAPHERAVNYAATNAFNAAKIFQTALKEEIELESIGVERSPICRPGSDCWDVKLTFFNPLKMFDQARKVYRFTIDVADVCPVMVGKLRSWYVR